jgi:hypothetical protein
MRAVLYDVEWQLIRIDCMSARAENGGWTTNEGTEYNLEVFRNYLYEQGIRYPEWMTRQYRVNNCINAVVMGLNAQQDASVRINMLRRFRDTHTHKDLYGAYVHVVALTWDWNKVAEEVSKMRKEDWQYLWVDLTKRSKNAASKTSRPELTKFMGIMQLHKPV